MLDRFARFSRAITEIDRCWHKLVAEETEKFGLNTPHAIYLNTLYCYPEGVTSAELCELCCTDKADVSRMVSILEKKGLVYRVAMGASRYRAKLLLTEKGRCVARHIRERAALAVARSGAGLSDEERQVFYRALEQITENMQALCKEGLPERLP